MDSKTSDSSPSPGSSSFALSRFAGALIKAYEKDAEKNQDKKVSVNPVVSKLATWYEKLRNVMDFRDDEVILRTAIERILKRLFLFGGTDKTVAEPLVRELVWARYFPNESISESVIKKVEEKVSLYFSLRTNILSHGQMQEKVVNEWMYQFLSCEIQHILSPNLEKETMTHFIYHIFKNSVQIEDDSEQTKDVQVFIAVRRAYAKDDIALLRFHLFAQVIEKLTQSNVDQVASGFYKAYREIKVQLSYKAQDKIFVYLKKRMAVFFILDDVLRTYKEKSTVLVKDQAQFKKAIFSACENRYSGISAKVNRAVMRSVIFIFITKALFALSIEGSVDNVLYGGIMWTPLFINIAVPPLLLLVVSFFIKAPGKDNSEKIFALMTDALSKDQPMLSEPLHFRKNPEKKSPVLQYVFTILWILAFFVTFGAVIITLNKLHFNFVSQGIFLFFLAIVSFLAYRIAVIPRAYTVDKKQGYVTPLIDLFFVPFITVGRLLTDRISQINIFIFIFDFLIEAPFKGMFTFFEQLFIFLHSKRDDLG